MLALVGGSASGKSTVEKILCDDYGYNKIISYTTRSPRVGESNGVDYHFIEKSEFIKLKSEGFFAETAEYNGWLYGTARKDCTDDKVAVLTPHGMRQLKKIPGIDIMSVYIKVPRRDRLIKILQRNDNIEEAKRRDASDVGMFDGIEDEVQYVFENEGYKTPPRYVANTIHNLYQDYKNHKVKKNKRMTILCDIDCVVNNLVSALLAKYNEKYNDSLTLDDITDYDITQFVKPECENIFKEFCTDEFLENLELQPKAKEVIEELIQYHDLYFVSSTFPSHVCAKDQWLQKNIKWYDSSKLIICRNKTLVHGDVLIDDCLGNFVFDPRKCPVRLNIVFDRPWNHNYNVDNANTIRANGWEEIKNIILQGGIHS